MRLPSSVTSSRPPTKGGARSEEHTSELQSRLHLVCRLLLEKKNKADSDMFFLPAAHLAHQLQPPLHADAAYHTDVKSDNSSQSQSQHALTRAMHRCSPPQQI